MGSIVLREQIVCNSAQLRHCHHKLPATASYQLKYFRRCVVISPLDKTYDSRRTGTIIHEYDSEILKNSCKGPLRTVRDGLQFVNYEGVETLCKEIDRKTQIKMDRWCD